MPHQEGALHAGVALGDQLLPRRERDGSVVGAGEPVMARAEPVDRPTSTYRRPYWSSAAARPRLVGDASLLDEATTAQ